MKILKFSIHFLKVYLSNHLLIDDLDQSLNESFASKSIILIDDSLVRGTTCFKIVKMLYEAGAKEVHVRIACPEIKFPDFYGVDMPTKDELLAHTKNNEEMRDYIKAKSLKFLSIDGLYAALGKGERNN